LHDAWLLTGHCAHSFDCERWLTGCGSCPDLTIYPDIKRDSTHANWSHKRQIYARSRVYVVTPSQWLMDIVRRSILAPGMVAARVIPNGINLEIFRLNDKTRVRARLGLPVDAHILVFAAHGIRNNLWKDYATLRSAMDHIAELPLDRDVLFLAVGEDAPSERNGRAEIRFIPYQQAPAALASYYQAADLCLYATHVDTFPTTVLESLGCGTPVIATAVGGIPEQIRGLADSRLAPVPDSRLNGFAPSEATGVLVPPADARAFSQAVAVLLSDTTLLCQLSENAAADARERFSLHLQVERYLAWYADILSEASSPALSRSLDKTGT
jgi:glycosyltransferase involved in cell wall biosynthesis